MSGRLWISAIPLLLLILSAPAAARTWVVHPDGTGDAPTIAAAVDSAYYTDDVIELVDGIYSGPGNCDLDNASKQIMIRSQSGDPASCIVDCQGTETDPHYGFRFYGDG